MKQQLLLAVILAFVNSSAALSSILVTCNTEDIKIKSIEFYRLTNIKARSVLMWMSSNDFRNNTYVGTVKCEDEVVGTSFYFEYPGKTTFG